MSRQTAMAAGATAGSSRAFRLDPSALPVRSAASFSSLGEASPQFFIDRDRAVIRTPALAGGSFTVPIAAYRGVAVRMAPHGADHVRFFVELLHRDRALTLTLAIADTAEDAAVDWQEWARALGLPLLLIDGQGEIRSTLPSDGDPLPRADIARRPNTLRFRRTRFSRRRKVGSLDPTERISGRELIARN